MILTKLTKLTKLTLDQTTNNQREMILAKLTKLTKLTTNSYNEDRYKVLSLPHSNLLELAVKDAYFSSDELISIANSKKKGFTLKSNATYEDIVKAIKSCPSSFFI